MADDSISPTDIATELLAGRADAWDHACELPSGVVRALGARGLLSAEVPRTLGGLGFTSQANGELTAHIGAICGSTRSVMTSQGIAAWALQRFGTDAQREEYLPQLSAGETMCVAFSEANAGSDLTGVRTTISQADECALVQGEKVWVTGAHYARWILVFGHCSKGAALAIVPASSPGVQIERVNNPLGCRAAGHAHVRFDGVRLASEEILGGRPLPSSLLISALLTYGRISVAWGCLGMLRACLAASARHAATRTTFGKPISEHQLIRRHIAELYVAERSLTAACERASRLWDEKSPEHVCAAVLAKYMGGRYAARGASTGLQILASAAAQDGNIVARAYRDAKLMEIIEGSNEISQLMLADEAMAVWA